MFKLVVIGLIIVGKDPFAFLGMQAPGIWEWGQGNKVSLTAATITTNILIFDYVSFFFARKTRSVWGQNRVTSGVFRLVCF